MSNQKISKKKFNVQKALSNFKAKMKNDSEKEIAFHE